MDIPFKQEPRTRSKTKLGLLLMLLGVLAFGGWLLWVHFMVTTPLDVPISMSVGHIHTPEFTLRISAYYLILVDVEKKPFPGDTLWCLLGNGDISPMWRAKCASSPSIIKASWTLQNEGEIVLQGSTEDEAGSGTAVTENSIGRAIGTFVGGRGCRYVLDVDVLADASRLNVGHPHLKVSAFPENPVNAYWEPLGLVATIALELTGIVILAVSLIGRAVSARHARRALIGRESHPQIRT